MKKDEAIHPISQINKRNMSKKRYRNIKRMKVRLTKQVFHVAPIRSCLPLVSCFLQHLSCFWINKPPLTQPHWKTFNWQKPSCENPSFYLPSSEMSSATRRWLRETALVRFSKKKKKGKAAPIKRIAVTSLCQRDQTEHPEGNKSWTLNVFQSSGLQFTSWELSFNH